MKWGMEVRHTVADCVTVTMMVDVTVATKVVTGGLEAYAEVSRSAQLSNTVLTVAVVVVVAVRVDVSVVVVGDTMQEHAALMMGGANAANAGNLYPLPEPFGGVHLGIGLRFCTGWTVSVVVIVLYLLEYAREFGRPDLLPRDRLTRSGCYQSHGARDSSVIY